MADLPGWVDPRKPRPFTEISATPAVRTQRRLACKGKSGIGTVSRAWSGRYGRGWVPSAEIHYSSQCCEFCSNGESGDPLDRPTRRL